MCVLYWIRFPAPVGGFTLGRIFTGVLCCTGGFLSTLRDVCRQWKRKPMSSHQEPEPTGRGGGGRREGGRRGMREDERGRGGEEGEGGQTEEGRGGDAGRSSWVS